MVSSRNTPNEWTIPGGGLEPNEDPRDTAAREAMEEVRVVNITSLYVDHYLLLIVDAVRGRHRFLRIIIILCSIGWSLS